MKKKIKLKGCHFSLTREADGAGDSGMMLNAIDPKTGKTAAINELRVGYAVQCGTFIARSYQHQDWWLTTPIKEIISVEKTKDAQIVKFTTGNSVYILRAT